MRARICGSQTWDYDVDVVVAPMAPRVLHLAEVGMTFTMCNELARFVDATPDQVETMEDCTSCSGYARTSGSGARSIRALVALEEIAKESA